MTNYSCARQGRIAELVREIQAAEAELQQLAAGHAVMTPGSARDLLTEVQETWPRSERETRAMAEIQTGILNALPAQIALLDAAGKIQAVNESWRRFAVANALQSPDFLVGHNYLEICENVTGCDAEEACAVAKGIRRVLLHEVKEFALEYPCHSPAAKRWFRVMVTPLTDRPQSGAVVMHVSITDLRLAEESLVASRQQYQDLVERTHDLIWAFDDTGIIRFMNQASVSILGRKPEEMVGHHIQEFIPPDQLPKDMGAFAEAIANGREETGFIVHTFHKNGARVSLDVNTRVLRNEAGRVVKCTCSGRDVTETLRAQIVLERSEACFRAVFDQAAVGMCLVSMQGRFLRVNHRYCEILGYAAEELLQLDYASVTHPEDGHLEAEIAGPLLSSENKSSHGEKRYLHKHGHSVWCSLTVSLIPEHDGEPGQFAIVAEDITQRHQAAQERDRAEAETQFAAIALGKIVQIQQELATADLPVEALLELIADRARNLVGGIGAIVNIGNGDDLICQACVGVACQDANLRLGRTGSLSELAVSTGVVMRFDDTDTDFRCDQDACRQIGVRSLIVLPLRVGAEIIGALEVAFDRPLAYNDRDIQNLQILAETLGVAIQRQRAGHLLRNSEEEFRTLAEVMPQIVWIAGADGRGTYFNHHWMDYTGLTVEESKGSNWSRSLHPDDRQLAEEAWHRAVTLLDEYAVECRLRHADGQYRWYLTRGEPLRDQDGRVMKWFGTCTDVNDLKIAEVEISRVNRALKMVSSCNEAMVRAESEAGLLAAYCRNCVANGGFFMAWVGYAQQDSARSISFQAQVGDPSGFLEKIKLSWDENSPYGVGPAGKVIRTGKPFVYSDTEVDDQTMAWRELTRECGIRSLIALPLRETGRCFGLLTLYSNEVTAPGPDEMKLLQELADDLSFGISHLRARESKRLADQKIAEQAKLLDRTTDAIFVRDLEYRVLFWNKGAEDLFGWKAKDAMGRPTTDLLLPDPDKFLEGIQSLMSKGEWAGELEKHNRDGKHIIVNCRWTLVRDEKGEPEFILCIETDVTEKKKLEHQILRAQRMESIGTLASGIAHDLNNILAPITMAVQLLREDARDEGAVKVLSTIESCSQRGADLIRQVLTFARGVEGQRVSVKLTDLLADMQKVMVEIFPKNVKIEFSPQPDLWTVVGDPTQLHQVFLNLCVNARDAMPHGGTLSISLENAVVDETYAAMNPDSTCGPFVLVCVCDSGAGMPPDILDRIFEPFFTTKQPGKGTGLGLSTVLGIVKNHGGFISLYSEVGVGSRFRVYIPANVSEQQAMDLAATQTRMPHGNGELILLVDDEKNIRDIAALILKRYGYNVLEAGNGAEAVSIYVQHQSGIALVLTDVSMPIMDGAALITALKSLNPSVRILVSSGLPTKDVVGRAMEAGDFGFIAKPYTAESLLSIISKELSKATEA